MSQEEMTCSESLTEILEGQGCFQSHSSRKRMEPGEGLTKIWMCPSSELAAALFSVKQPQVTYNAGDSLNVLEKLTTEVSDYGDSPETSYKDWSSSLGDSGDKESVSVELLSISTEASFQDERLDNLKRLLKETYDKRLAQGAEMVIDHSLKKLDDQLYKLVKEIRWQEENRINQELMPISDFINKHLLEVNHENGYKLKKKYSGQRETCITRLIDSAEENFSYKCVQIDKQLFEKYLFRVKKIKNHFFADYKERLREEMTKWITRFKEEKNKIMKEYENATASIKDKYDNLYRTLKAIEKDKVQVELERVKQNMANMEAAQTGAPTVLHEKCSDVSSWLCVLYHLLTDMQQFMKKYIGAEADVRRLLVRVLFQRKSMRESLRKKLKSVTAGPVIENASDMIIKEASVDSVPCFKGRDEQLHRVLVREAEIILENILSDISKERIKKEDFDFVPKNLYQYQTLDEVVYVARHFQSDEDHSYYNFSLYDDAVDSSSGSIFTVFNF